MRLLVRWLTGTTVAFLTAGTAALAQGNNCTHDALPLDGGPIVATFCVTTAPGAGVTVTETFVRGADHFSRPLAIEPVSGAAVTRTVDDVPLTGFGLNKLLHLTIAYSGGTAKLEHALLLPGALVLK